MTARLRASFGRVTIGVLTALVALSVVFAVTIHRTARAGAPGAYHMPPTFDLDGDGTH